MERTDGRGGPVDINGSTKVLGVIGWPVEHSLSPAMQNAALQSLQLDYCYVAFPVSPESLYDAVKGTRALGIKGINVTVPHKEAIIPFLDEVDQEALSIGAVNTVNNEQGRLKGYNTDGRGFMHALKEAGVEVAGKRVLLIGAGGAARAVAYYLAQEAGSLTLYNRNSEKTYALRDHLATGEKRVLAVDSTAFQSQELFSEIDIIVNTTPLGLKPDDPPPLDTALLRKGHVVCDLIYKETPLLKAAQAKGCITVDGSGMLLWQGVLAFQIWTGMQPPVEVMRETLRRQGQ